MATIPVTATDTRHVYLNFNASTPLDPVVISAIRPLLQDHYGNPSSQHWAGRGAREIVEGARAEVAGLLNAAPRQIVLSRRDSSTERLPNTLNISFRNRPAYELLPRLDGVAASAGSACHAGTSSVSPVLTAMGVEPEIAVGAIRFSLGRTKIEDDLEYAIAQLKTHLPQA